MLFNGYYYRDNCRIISRVLIILFIFQSTIYPFSHQYQDNSELETMLIEEMAQADFGFGGCQMGAGVGLPILFASMILALVKETKADVKYWNGATNKLFSNSGNWVGGVAPVAGDSIIFDIQGTNKPCSVGANTPSLASVVFNNDYTGYLTFRAGTVYTMSISGDADFRSGGDIIPNSGQISFTGSSAAQFFARAGDTMPRLIINATAGTAPWLTLIGNWAIAGLTLTNGNIAFGTGLDSFTVTGTVTSASTADTVDFAGSVINFSGTSTNLRYGRYMRTLSGGSINFNYAGLSAFYPNNVNVTSMYSDIVITNGCSLRVLSYPLRSAGRLLVDNGSINIEGVTCSLGTVGCVNGGNFIMTGGANVCVNGDTLDLNSFTNFSQTTGTLRFYGNNDKVFIPFPGVTLPQLIVLGPGNVTMKANSVISGIVTLSGGSLVSEGSMIVTGNLTATLPLVMLGDSLDLSGSGTIATIGTIAFSKTFGTQVFIPKNATTHPDVIHNGASRLEITDNALTARSFLQNTGELDLNGLSLTITVGSLRLVNGTSSSLQNFDGVTLTAPAGQFIQLSGTPGSRLNLQAATSLSLSAGGITRGRVVIEYADMQNVTVSGTNGLALNSFSIAGNSGFEVLPGRLWDGDGIGGNWSDPLNWSNDAIPSDSETVFFGLYSLKSCTLDISSQIKGIISLAGNSSRFAFGVDTMKVAGEADFRVFSAVDAGSGALEFVNSDSVLFYPRASVFPTIVQNGTGVTTVQAANVTGNELLLKKGMFALGHSRTNTFNNIRTYPGSGLDMDSASYLRVVGDTADFRGVDTLLHSHGNTGTLQFYGSPTLRQVYFPSPTQWHYQIHQNSTDSACTTFVLANGVKTFSYFYLYTGTLHLGNALNHEVNRFYSRKGGNISFGNSELKVNNSVAEFDSSEINYEPGARIHLAYDLGTSYLYGRRDMSITNYKLPEIKVNIPRRSLTIYGTLHTEGLLATAGTIVLPNDTSILGYVNTTPVDTGRLTFSSSTHLRVYGSSFDLSNLKAITPSSGILEFVSDTGVQLFAPLFNSTHPDFVHTGNGTVSLSQNSLLTRSFLQTAGTMDLNGLNITARKITSAPVSTGNFTIKNGNSTSIKGLGNTTITVDGATALDGISVANPLVMVPEDAWSIASIGLLNANNAVIGKSTALQTTGRAKNSVDSGGNDNWLFVAGRTWTNSSGDFSWKNPANWSDSLLPGENDTVVFDGEYPYSCILDTSVTVGGYVAFSNFRQTFDFNGNTLRIKTIADFRGDSTVHANGGLLEFIGTTTQLFYPDSGDTFPAIRQNGIGGTVIQKYSLTSEGDLEIFSGSTDLGAGALKHVVRSIKGTGGNIAFNNSTVAVVGDTADFRNVAVIQGTGTLQFSGNGKQYFIPRAGGWFYRLVMNGVNDTVIIKQNDLWLSNNLVLNSGYLDLGNSLNHTVAAVTSDTNGMLDFSSSILTVRGNAYMQSLSTIVPGSGTLILAGGNGTRLRVKSELVFNSIIRNGTGTAYFDSSLTCRRLSVNYGTLHLGGTAGRVHNVLTDLSGPGILQFGTAVLNYYGTILDLTPLSRIIANTGKLNFASDSTDQFFTPMLDSIHPVISHTGIRKLILESNDLLSMGFEQTPSAGSTDLNGRNIAVQTGGYLNVSDSIESTPPFLNLGGRTISVGGPATFSGKDTVNMINLVGDSPWHIVVNGVLTAQYAKIGNSIADSSEGAALFSHDSGGNSRWAFNVRIWDGDAGDSLWSNPVNWSGDVLPMPDEVVRFNTGSMPCSLDVSYSVKSLLFDSGYTGTFYFSKSVLSVETDVDFRSGGNFVGKANVQFTGSSYQSFFPSSALRFGTVRQTGNGYTRVYQLGFSADTIDAVAGTLNLGTGLTDTVGVIKGSGILELGNVVLYIIGEVVDFSLLDSLNPGNSTLYFENSSPLVLKPKSGTAMNIVYIQSSDSVKIEDGNLTISNYLYVKTGILHLGNGKDHRIYRVTYIAPNSGGIAFGSSRMIVTGNIADFRGIRPYIDSSAACGSLEFEYALGNTTFRPFRGAIFPDIVVNTPLRTVAVGSYGFNAGRLRMVAGTFNLGNYRDTVHSISGSGNIIFNVATMLCVKGDTANFSQMSSIVPSTGTINFMGLSGDQILVPKEGTLLPPVFITGSSKVKLESYTLSTLGFTQSSGVVDFNGQNISVGSNGSFTVTNGNNTSIVNLDGRTITVAGNCAFNGTALASLNLKAATRWTLEVSGALSANFAEIKNCSAAITPGIAMNSSDSGGNIDWIFLSGKRWSGAAGNNLWSDALNWNDSTAPNNNDTLIFDNTGVASCTLDISDTIASIVFTAGYTGVFSFNNNSLVVTGNLDFRSGGAILSGALAKLVLSGDGTRVLIPRSGNVPFPDIEQYGDGNTRIAVNSLRAGRLKVDGGIFHMGSALKDTFETVSGSGTIDFGSSFVSINGLNADFSGLYNLIPGTGTLQFVGNNVTQNFRPTDIATLPSVIIRNVGSGAVQLQAALRANALTVTTGTLYLGSGLVHSVASIAGGTGGTINFGTSVLQTSGNVNLSNPNIVASNGTLEFNGIAGQLFYTKTGQYYPMLVQSGIGSVTLVNNRDLVAKGLSVYGSRFNFNNRIHSVDTLFGTGVINLASSTVRTTARVVDLTTFEQVIPGSGNVEFTGTAGTQIFIPRTDTVNPGIFHSGNGILRFSGTPFSMMRFNQSAGVLDLNGTDPSVLHAGYFYIQNGEDGSVVNLDGRTISVDGNALLAGSGSTILNLKTTIPWRLAVNGSVTAEYSVIKNCTASVSTGIAINSADSGGNFNWSFASARVWDGEGLDNNWSNPVNWSDDILPTSTDIALFNITSTKNCVLDQDVTVGHIIFRSGYVGTLSFGASMLSVSGNADFANIGAVIPGSGILRFNGTVPQTFVPRSGGAIFPKIIVECTNIATITTQPLTVYDLEIRSGTLNFGGGLTHAINGNLTASGGKVHFGSSGVNFYGKTANFANLDSIIPSGGYFNFAASADTQLVYPKTGQSLPALYHNGMATMRIMGANLRALSFSQTGFNTLDLNGWNITLTTGDFTLVGGYENSIVNLGGRTIFVQGNANLGGTAGNLLGLAPSSLWHINVKGSLMSTLARVGNSIADDATGMGMNSVPADSNNVNWFFENGVVWDGEGIDSLWSTPDNWSTNALPSDTDIVLFSSASSKECALDIDVKVKRLLFLPGYTGNFHFDEQKLTVTTNADFRSGGTFTSVSGAVLDMAGKSLQRIFPPAGQALPNILVSDTGGVVLTQNALTAGSINVLKGYLDLDSGKTHTVVDVAGAGKLIFRNSILRIMGSDIQMGGFDKIDRGTGQLLFAAASGTQNIVPHATDTLPAISHSGAGTLRLSTRDLKCVSFVQNAGKIDFNSKNMNVYGSFSIANGTSASVSGLSGITLTVTGSTSFSGQNGNLMGLNPLSKWSIASTGALSANYAVIANCSAKVVAGVSTASRNGGGNYRWSFPAVVWDGGGVGNNWSTIANWSGDALPLSNDSVVFNSTSVKSSNLDINDTVKSITFTAPYTGMFSFGNSELVISEGSADFRSGGTITAGSGSLVFSGGAGISQKLIAKSGTLFPRIYKKGASTLTQLTNPFSTSSFLHEMGTLNLNTALAVQDSLIVNDSVNFGIALAHSTGSICGTGKVNFNSSTLRVTGANADFRDMTNIVSGTGVLRFIGSGGQSFRPKALFVHPAIIQDGSGRTVIENNSMIAGNLTLTSGVFDLGDGFTHNVSAVSGSANCTLLIRNSVLRVSGSSFDVSSLGKFSADSGVVEMAGSIGQSFRTKAGAVIRKIVQNGTGGTILQSNPINRLDTLFVQSGSVNLGVGLTHKIGTIYGTGIMNFGSSVLETDGDTINLSNMATIVPSTGILRFIGDTADTQILMPKNLSTLPSIEHPNSGILVVSGAPLQCLALAMSNGEFDMNGNNLVVTGNLSFTNGDTATLVNLGGRTITVGGNALFSGNNGNPINLNPETSWTISATGTLIADYAKISNSNATASEGLASNSTNLGGNVRWKFGAKVWDGGGADNNWSTKENWTSDVLPTMYDSVLFNGTSVKSCVLDISDTVSSFILTNGYTGNFEFTTDTLVVYGNSDFRSGGNISGESSGGSVLLKSSVTHSIFGRLNDTLPPIIKEGSGSLNVLSVPLNTTTFIVNDGAAQLTVALNTGSMEVNGNLALGIGLTHVAGAFGGASGTINFGSSVLSLSGDIDMSQIASVIPGTGSLRFIGSVSQNFIPPANDTLPLLEQNGAGGTIVSGSLKCSSLVISNGEFDLNGGANHLTGSVSGNGELVLGTSVLKITGANCDFSALSSFSATNGTIEMAGGTAQTLKPRPGSIIGKIIQSGSGSTTVSTNSFVADTLVLSSGRFNLGSSLVDTILQFKGNGHLDFGTSILVMEADTIDFNQLSQITAGSGSLFLTGGAGETQHLKPKPGFVLPTIVHNDSGCLRITGSALTATAISFQKGIFDLNGFDIHVLGNLNVVGDSLTFENLGGRILSVGGDALLGGKTGNLLNLNPLTPWTLAVNGNLTASLARIRNNTASISEGTALVSTDEGGNVNWNFAGKEWVAIGPDNLWSNPANWSGGALPLANEGVIFGSSSVLPCSLDISTTIKSIQFTPFYTGEFHFGEDTLALSGKGRASFRSGGSYATAGGILRFTGDSAQFLESDISDTLPDILHDGSGTLTIRNGTLVAGIIMADSGFTIVSDSFTAYLDGINGRGNLELGTGTVIVSRGDVDLSQLNSFDPGKSMFDMRNSASVELKLGFSDSLFGMLQSGSGSTRIAGAPLKVLDLLNITAGTVILSDIPEHDIGSLTGLSAGALDLGTSSINVRELADFSSLRITKQNNSSIKLVGAMPCTLRSQRADTLPDIHFSNTATMAIQGDTLIAGTVFVDSGNVFLNCYVNVQQFITRNGELHIGSSKTIDISKYSADGGGLHFGNGGKMVISGDTADFVQLDTLYNDNGSIVFTGTGNQYFLPRNYHYHPSIHMAGSGELIIDSSPLITGNIIVDSGIVRLNVSVTGDTLIIDSMGVLKLGTGNIHNISEVVLGEHGGKLYFNQSTLRISKNANFTNTEVSRDTGRLELSGSVLQQFRPPQSGSFSSIIYSGNDTVLLLDREFTSDTLSIASGTLRLGSGFTYTVAEKISGAGSLMFGNAIIDYAGESVDFSTFNDISYSTGVLRFSGTGTQTVVAKISDTLPAIQHIGTGRLQFASNPVRMKSFSSATGNIGLGGLAIYATDGNFTIVGGKSTSITGLDGASLSAYGDIMLNGTNGDLLNINTTGSWSVHAGGALAAQYAMIGNSNALSGNGMAQYSVDMDGNSGWVFGEKFWDGEGMDSRWTTAANWSGDVLPVANDRIRLDATSIKDIELDTNVIIRTLTFDSSYTGDLTFNGYAIEIVRSADLRSGGTLSGSGLLVFSGNEADTFYSNSGDTLPSIELSGNGTLSIVSGSVLTRKFTVGAGSVISLDNADIVVKEFDGAGGISLNNNAELECYGDSLEFGSIDAFTASNGGRIVFSGSGAQKLKSRSGIAFPAVVKSNGGTLAVSSGELVAESLIVDGGIVDIGGTGLHHTLGAITGTGSITFTNARISVTGDALFSNMLAVSSSVNDTLFFDASSGAQFLAAKEGAVLPVIVHDSASTLLLAGANLNTFALLCRNGVLDINGRNIATTGDLLVDAGGGDAIINFASCTLTVGGTAYLAGTMTNKLNLNPPSTWWLDASTGAEAHYAVVGKSNASLGVEATPYSCIDSMDNVNWGFNEPPAIGDTSLYVIPANRIRQSLDGSGMLTIFFRVIDQDSNTVSLREFSYSPDGGVNWYSPANGDLSLSLGSNWPDSGGFRFPSKRNYTGRINTFTFNTHHADVRSVFSLDSADLTSFRVRFKAHDGRVASTNYGVSANIVLDNKPPVVTIPVMFATGYPSADSSRFKLVAAFNETRPVNNTWHYKLNGSSYGAGINGTDFTATPEPLSVAIQLTSRDSIDAIKIISIDSLGNVGSSENVTVAYVKPKRPDRPLLSLTTDARLMLSVDTANGEVSGLDYAVLVDSASSSTYLRSDGSRGVVPEWQKAQIWDSVLINSIHEPFSSYLFRAKSRHAFNNDIESDFSAAASTMPLKPIVKEIAANQRKDGSDTVDVAFRIYDIDNSTVTVNVQYRLGEGAWSNISGVILAGSYASIDSTIVHGLKWSLQDDLDSTHFTDSTFIRIIVFDADNLADTMNFGPFKTDLERPEPVQALVFYSVSPSVVAVNWQQPTSSDADSVMVRYSIDSANSPLTTDEALLSNVYDVFALTDTISGIGSDTRVNVTIFVKDSFGHWSVPVSVSGKTIDTIVPLPVTAFSIPVVMPGGAIIEWQSSSSNDADSVLIRYRVDSTAPANATDGVLWKVVHASVSSDTVQNLLSDTRYDFSLFVRDVNGNYSIPASGYFVTIDTISPEPVDSLFLHAIDAGTIGLEWLSSVSHDAESLMIRIDTGSVAPVDTNSGHFVTMIPASKTADTITGLISDMQYSVALFVRDVHGNWSMPVTGNSRTPDTISPMPVTSLLSFPIDLTSLLLEWNGSASMDVDSLMIRFRTDSIFPSDTGDGVLWKRSEAALLSDTVFGLANGQIYRFSIFVRDSNGNWSDPAVVMGGTKDSILPPDSLFVRSLSAGSISLAWTPTPSADADSIEIRFRDDTIPPINHLDGILWKTISVAEFADTITGLLSDKFYHISLFAKDAYGNYSRGISGSTKTQDTLRPEAVTSFAATATGPGSILLSWVPSASTDIDSLMIRVDTGSIAPIEIFSGFLALVASTAMDNDTVKNLVSDMLYSFSLFVKDTNGNWSIPAMATAKTVDTITPQPITNIVLTPISFSSVVLEWTPSESYDADSVMIRYSSDTLLPVDTLSGNLWAMLPASDSLDTISGIVSGEFYRFALYVRDINGNWSAATEIVGTPLDSIIPRLSGSVDDTLRFVRIKDGSGRHRFDYRVADGNDSVVWVSMQYFNGTAWLNASSEGDTGMVAVSDSITRTIYWLAKNDLAQNDTSAAIRIIATDFKSDYSYDTLATEHFDVDMMPPKAISASIVDTNGFTSLMNVHVVLNAEGADSVALAWNDSTAFDVIYPYGDSMVSPILVAEGHNVLYVQFGDSLGNRSTIIMRDTTILDTTKPLAVLSSVLSGRRVKSGLSRSIEYKGDDTYLKLVKLEWRDAASDWDTVVTLTSDSGIFEWLIPETNDSLVFLRLLAFDSAGNSSADSFQFIVAEKAGTPVYLRLEPVSVIMSIDSVVQISVSGKDADSIPIAAEDIVWQLKDSCGHIDSLGNFMAFKSGRTSIVAEYLGVSATIDSVVIFHEARVQTGITRINEWLSLQFSGEPQGGIIRIVEVGSIADSVLLNSIMPVVPLLDFSLSDSIPSSVVIKSIVRVDSINNAQINDIGLLRTFISDSVEGQWNVDFGSIPDTLGTISSVVNLFRLFMVGQDTLVPEMVNTSDTSIVAVPGNSIKVTGSMTDNINNTQVMFYYRNGGIEHFDSALVARDSTGEFSFNATGLSSNGYEYFMRANDGTGTNEFPRTNVLTRATNYAKPSPFVTGEWRMVSVPAIPVVDSLQPFFRALGKYLEKWRVYEWNGSSYVELGNNTSAKIEAGKAYWYKTFTPNQTPAMDSVYMVPINRCFEIVLQPGVWTPFSNPYNYPVSWNRILDSTSGSSVLMGPYTYEGGSWLPPSAITNIIPWSGYYVMNTGTLPVTMRIPSIAAGNTPKLYSINKMNDDLDTLDWQLELVVKSGSDSSKYNYFGTVNRRDAWQPPSALGGKLSVSFVRNGKRLIESYLKSSSDKGGIWPVTVFSSADARDYSLHLYGIEKLPDGICAVVVDKKRGLKATLNGTTEFCFSINQDEKGRELLIIAGDSAFVAKSTAGILDVPLTFSLSQNMPNPFNPVTTIKYTVAEKKKGAQHVSMKVYDARGRFVKMLVNEKLESGYYSVTWNGKNAKGESLGSGLYFYSIAVGRDFRKVRKMVVLK